MKHIILYGPGTTPYMLVDDQKAVEITGKFKNGEAFEVESGNSMIYVRENSCWAMKVEEFEERRNKIR